MGRCDSKTLEMGSEECEVRWIPPLWGCLTSLAGTTAAVILLVFQPGKQNLLSSLSDLYSKALTQPPYHHHWSAAPADFKSHRQNDEINLQWLWQIQPYRAQGTAAIIVLFINGCGEDSQNICCKMKLSFNFSPFKKGSWIFPIRSFKLPNQSTVQYQGFWVDFAQAPKLSQGNLSAAVPSGAVWVGRDIQHTHTLCSLTHTQKSNSQNPLSGWQNHISRMGNLSKLQIAWSHQFNTESDGAGLLHGTSSCLQGCQPDYWAELKG